MVLNGFFNKNRLDYGVPYLVTFGYALLNPQAAQAHYRNADVTPACEWCCVKNGYYKGLYGM